MREPSGPEALIFSLYDAAQDPRQWAGLAPQLAKALNAESAAIQVKPPGDVHTQILSRTRNFSDEDEQAYRSYYHCRDVLIERAASRGLNQILGNRDLMSEHEWANSEIYRDFFRPLGIHHILGGLVSLPGDHVAVFAVHRELNSKPFSAKDKAFLSRLAPHLQNAIKIQQSLHSATLEQHVAKDFVARSPTALLVVDRAGRLLLANAKGEALLGRRHGLGLVGGRIAAPDSAVHDRLLRLVETAVDTAAGRGEGAGGTLTIPSAHHRPLSVTVAPLRPQQQGLGLPEPAALIFVRDPGERLEVVNALRDLYGLTRGEALIANALINGLNLHEIAFAQNVTLHTVRSQVKTIFVKTATSRQTELVALLLRSTADQL